MNKYIKKKQNKKTTTSCISIKQALTIYLKKLIYIYEGVKEGAVANWSKCDFPQNVISHIDTYTFDSN